MHTADAAASDARRVAIGRSCRSPSRASREASSRRESSQRSASVCCRDDAADPLAPLAELPGVAAAGEEAREALGRAHRHRTNLRGWPTTAAEASLRAARASSVLDGGSLQLSEDGDPDPVLAGALRVAEALEGGATSLVGVWQRAPLQAIARLHALAAADLADDDSLGRPRGDAEVGRRLELLADIVTGGTKVPAPVLAAVAHGELLTLEPFGTADGVVAPCGVAAGDDRQRSGPAWPRRAGDVLDAPLGRLSGRGAGILRRVHRTVLQRGLC